MGTTPNEMSRREPAYDPSDKDPEEIRADIERTRADMSETVDELQERLSPQRLKAQAQTAVHDATIGRAKEVAENVSYQARSMGARVRESVRENPIPAAMIAVGAGWLFMESRSRRRERLEFSGYDTYGYTAYGAAETEQPGFKEKSGEMIGRAGERVSDVAGQAGDRASQVAQEAKDRASHAVSAAQEKAGELVSSAQDRASDISQAARERASEVSHAARERVDTTRQQVGGWVHENPLAAGAAVLAVGALIGMALPATRQESKLLGPTRDNLVDNLKTKAQDTAERVQHVAREAGLAAKEKAEDTARDEGLTSEHGSMQM